MTIKTFKIEEDFNRDLYWTKILIQSDKNNAESVIYVCASWEYLCDINKINKITKKYLDSWLENNVKHEIKNREKEFLLKKINYIVFTNTKEGAENGLMFLKEKTR